MVKSPLFEMSEMTRVGSNHLCPACRSVPQGPTGCPFVNCLLTPILHHKLHVSGSAGAQDPLIWVCLVTIEQNGKQVLLWRAGSRTACAFVNVCLPAYETGCVHVRQAHPRAHAGMHSARKQERPGHTHAQSGPTSKKKRQALGSEHRFSGLFFATVL